MKLTITLIFAGVLCLGTNAQLITATGSMASKRVSHGSKTLSNGKVLVFGGDNGDGTTYQVHNTAELYSNGTWSATGSMQKNRRVPASAVLSNGNVLVIGGRDENQVEFSSCEIYNVASGTWSYAGSMSNERSASIAITLNNGKILAVGGEYTKTCELYDQTSNTWSTTGSLLTTRDAWFDATKLPNGNVLITGGNTATAEIYDVAAGTWSVVANQMQTSRSASTAILMANGKVLIAGGDFTKASEVFNPTTNTFTAAGDMGQYASASDMINLSDGTVLIYSTGDLFSLDRKALQLFNPTSNTWSSAGTVGPSIYTANDYTVNRLSNGKILYSGGNWTTGNGANEQCYLVGLAAAGLEEAQAADLFNVYPVPAKDYIKVDCNPLIAASGYTLMISNSLGQVLYSTSVNQQTSTIDLQNLVNSGIYFIGIKDNQNEIVQTTRFIVQ